MGRSVVLFCVLLAELICNGASSFLIRNKLLGKCLQAQARPPHSSISTADCSSTSLWQEWRWHADSAALESGHTGQCLTTPAEPHGAVGLRPCMDQRSEGEPAGLGDEEEGKGEDAGTRKSKAHRQAWACSRRGHLTLQGEGIHLIATKDSVLVFLSKEHKQHGNRWLKLDNQTVCGEQGDRSPHSQSHQDPPHLAVSPTVITSTKSQPIGDGDEDYQNSTVSEPVPLRMSTSAPGESTMMFYAMDYGMSWKIAMLVLSSLALVLGTVILILNVHSNRRRKVVCVLRPCSPRGEVSIPGSPLPSERAPLTRHAMCLPHSSPSLRGEILIEWKDGTVTPLYEG